MRLVPLTAYAMACACTALGQVSVTEPATRAHIVNGSTTISLALSNSAKVTLQATVELQWLDPDVRKHGSQRRTIEVPPGDSVAEIPLPLGDGYDPLLDRLQYDVIPAERNYTAFAPVKGIVNFTQLADYAFMLHVVTAGRPRPDRPFEVRVIASHAANGRPVSGVSVTSGKASAVSGSDGLAVLRVVLKPGDANDLPIQARIGDFRQSGAASGLDLMPGDLRIDTDKPLYQPGQTLHARILARGPDGRARGGLECRIQILDERGDAVQTAEAKTSPFGVASTDWEIPPNAKSGSYMLEVESELFDRPVTRPVVVRRYELPSFRVSAKLDRPYYLLHQKAGVEIAGEYLFGKPVSSGRVRIVEGDSEKALLEGALDAAGRFRGTIDTGEMKTRERFIDRHFTAFLTDTSTNRVEQRMFDLRVSRDALHVRLVKAERRDDRLRLFVTTFSPDGSPVGSRVEARMGSRVVGTGRTNRFGVALIDAASDEDNDEIEIRAAAADGRQAAYVSERSVDEPNFWIDTERSLYRAGDTIRCRIGTDGNQPRVLLMAWNESGETLFSRMVPLKDGAAEISIPYDKRFGRKLSLGVASLVNGSTAGRTVLFPGQDDLSVQAMPEKAAYRPGETAALRFHASSEAALGIAIIDESVLERAATDSAFGRRHWFLSPESRMDLGGITAEDLETLDPARIDADLQLVAEVLLEGPQFAHEAPNPLAFELQRRFIDVGAKALEPTRQALSRHYMERLDYPRDEAALAQVAPALPLDPWLRPYFPRFTTEQSQDVLCFMSAGPDKQRGTADDYCALPIYRGWFATYEAQIRQVLHGQVDYPAQPEQFVRLLDDAGIRFDALRDPWGGRLRVAIEHSMDWRLIKIWSAGPDRRQGTSDDFQVAFFQGSYFSATSAKIQGALSNARKWPRTAREFLTALAAAGIRFDALRDPWGHEYYVEFQRFESSSERIRIYSFAEYQGTAEARKEITPIKRRVETISIRTMGKDGRKGTLDDCEVATVSRLVEPPESPSVSKARYPDRPAAGAGTMAGAVRDQTGASIPGTLVTLNDSYTMRTGEDGGYTFRGLLPGMYRVRFDASGFRRMVIDRIPLAADHVTQVNAMLEVADASQTVMVMAEAAVLNTDMASAPAEATVSTPRVREYFPETLYWQPELVTDASGNASVEVKLADSITTWRVAVIASTRDGRITETSAAVRAFQPFQVELDAPAVLTAGDEIALPVPVRNYLLRAQEVAVSLAATRLLPLAREVAQPGVVPAAEFRAATLHLRAAAAGEAPLRVTARGEGAADAIEKRVAVHPDGELRERTVNTVMTGGHPVKLEVPAAAIPGSMRAQLKIYPSLVARILESMNALLQRPHGCGEQTISSTYPNLLLLNALKQADVHDQRLEARALANVRAGYQRLLGYQNEDGGFTYWGRGEADAALTSYAVEFLRAAKEFVDVDEERIDHAVEWLGSHKVERGAAVLRGDIDEELGALARDAAEYGDPYAIAAFILAALDAGKLEAARVEIDRLAHLAHDEEGAAYWSLEGNTPFHGWGRAGQVESTALAVSALARWRKRGGSAPDLGALIDRGALFLLRNAQGYGGWSSGQATVRALTALLDTWSADSSPASTIQVLVNGVTAGAVAIPAGSAIAGPVTVDISRLVKTGPANEIALAGADGRALQAQVDAEWYEPWAASRHSEDLAFETRYSTLSPAINQSVSCDVTISRPSFRGYGMMIAEVGLPPGAEVDRGTLAGIVDDPKSGVDSVEVAPDHVTFYVWPRAADSRFRFVFRPRFAMNASAAQSVLYDYYNPDARVVLPPPRFRVR